MTPTNLQGGEGGGNSAVACVEDYPTVYLLTSLSAPLPDTKEQWKTNGGDTSKRESVYSCQCVKDTRFDCGEETSSLIEYVRIREDGCR